MMILELAGVVVKTPDSFDRQVEDVDSSDTGLREDAYLFRRRLRKNRVKLNVAWTNISAAELRKIEAARDNAAISVRYFWCGSLYSEKMYMGSLAETCKNAALGLYDAQTSLIAY